MFHDAKQTSKRFALPPVVPIMDKEFTSISIPTSLYKKIEETIKGTETASVSAYIVNLLREALSKEEAKPEVFNAEEEEKVKDRLKALGYID